MDKRTFKKVNAMCIDIALKHNNNSDNNIDVLHFNDSIFVISSVFTRLTIQELISVATICDTYFYVKTTEDNKVAFVLF